MFVIYDRLTDEAIASLKQLQLELPHSFSDSHRRRMGENGPKALSEYYYTRWFNWNADSRRRFKSALPKVQTEAAVVGWYLELKPRTGFLDRITTWVGEVQSGTMISYALNGSQTIRINDEDVVVPKGCGIGFNTRNVHEIRPSKRGQLWACMMVLDDPKVYIPK